MTTFADTLLNSSIRISLVAAVVALLLLIVRVRSSAVRHSAWVAVLCAMLLMPVLRYCVPAVPVPIPLPSNLSDAIPVMPAAPTLPFPAAVVRERPALADPAPIAAIPHVAQARGPIWGLLGILLYVCSVTTLLARLLFGWRSAQRMARTSRPVPELSGPHTVYESSLIAVPLTIGVFVPRITLPLAWREWPNQKLRAVLAHESEHVRRRDSVVALLAHLNRCVFWFHPLAWWLERKLAVTAEQSCDDAGIQAVGEPRRYAEILLDLAETVRTCGGRYSWQGIGMDGAGLLGQRIDRILCSGLPSPVSPARKAMVAFGCAAAIILAAGCRQQLTVAPLEDNPQRVNVQADTKWMQEFAKAAETMTAEQAAALESTLQKNLDNLDTHKKLLIFYSRSGEKTLGAAKTITRKRPHVLWLIEHHPEDAFTTYPDAQIFPTALDRLPDPGGYAQAKRAWLAQTDSSQTSAKVLSHAASFFRAVDKPLAEQCLLRAQALDPKGRWSTQLGILYYQALVGSNASMPMGFVRSVNLADVHGAYAAEIRKKLATTSDAELLAVTGEMLSIWGRNLIEAHNIDFDPVPLGKSYLERALQLDPQSITAHRDLERIRIQERDRPLIDARRNKQEAQYASSLPEQERYRVLAQLAEQAYIRGDMAAYYHHDAAEAKARFAEARTHARQALQLAAKFRNDTDYGTAVYVANMSLGMVAMQEGSRKAAVQYMSEASKAPRTEELAYSMEYLTLKLPAWLLKDGERQSVIDFLERFAQVNVAQKAYLLESATQIRNGQKPLWYQN
jgi:beta-lactamase regulating signal transducer with metallopeptidase domain